MAARKGLAIHFHLVAFSRRAAAVTSSINVPRIAVYRATASKASHRKMVSHLFLEKGY